MIRIGIDIGGTFTDFALWDGDRAGYTAVHAMKMPSTPPDFARGVQDGLEVLLAEGRIAAGDPMLIVHGTTVSTNAVIERSGPPLALLVTAGFRDLGRAHGDARDQCPRDPCPASLHAARGIRVFRIGARRLLLHRFHDY